MDELCLESPAGPEALYLSPDGGNMKTGFRGGVFWVQVTGGVLASLRGLRLLDSYLMAFGIRPHRVTRLDAALDLPLESPPVLSRLYDQAKAGSVSLSRKRLGLGQLHKILEPALYGGPDTGTVYLGRSTAEVRLKVYDKRQERLKRTGVDIGSPLTRFEVTVTGKMGASLRDASSPQSLFYHFISPSVLSAPPGVPPWVPYVGGYEVARADTVPYQALKRRVESSRELGRLVALANDCGPHGLDLLVSLLRRYHAASRPAPS